MSTATTDVTIALDTPEATIYQGDCLDVMRSMPDASVDAIVTDPPYGLSELAAGALADVLSAWLAGDRAAAPKGRGFMGKSWDAFVPPPAVWDEAYRVLKPGGHLLAFAGSRTDDLMGLSIRLAGFELRDGIAWLYGSGFPKSLDVGAAIDKLDAAAERRARALRFTEWMRAARVTAAQLDAATGSSMGSHYLTDGEQPHVPTADMFDRMRPLLPAVPAWVEELIEDRRVESENYAAREVTGKHEKPAAASVWREKYEGGSVPQLAERRDMPHTPEAQRWQGWGTALKPAFEPIVVARKPMKGTVAANVVAHGTGALNIDACRTGWGAEGDQSAARKAAGYSDAAKKALGKTVANESTTGFASEVVGTDASKGRFPANVVLDEFTAGALDEQSGTLTSGMMRAGTQRAPRDGVVYGRLEGDASGSDTYGDSGGASRFFYTAKASSSERPNVGGVMHPTVKPLDLMRWLVRLVTPRGGVVLEPFAGSGTTVEAAVAEGFRCIGIEREPDYLPLILARLSKPIAQGLDLWGGDAA